MIEAIPLVTINGVGSSLSVILRQLGYVPILASKDGATIWQQGTSHWLVIDPLSFNYVTVPNGLAWLHHDGTITYYAPDISGQSHGISKLSLSKFDGVEAELDRRSPIITCASGLGTLLDYKQDHGHLGLAPAHDNMTTTNIVVDGQGMTESVYTYNKYFKHIFLNYGGAGRCTVVVIDTENIATTMCQYALMGLTNMNLYEPDLDFGPRNKVINQFKLGAIGSKNNYSLFTAYHITSQLWLNLVIVVRERKGHAKHHASIYAKIAAQFQTHH